jgi:hypothetical protein
VSLRGAGAPTKGPRIKGQTGARAMAPGGAAAPRAAPAQTPHANTLSPRSALVFDRGCMGGGRVRWWAVNVLEGREVGGRRGACRGGGAVAPGRGPAAAPPAPGSRAVAPGSGAPSWVPSRLFRAKPNQTKPVQPKAPQTKPNQTKPAHIKPK